jgi:hypothetical protein
MRHRFAILIGLLLPFGVYADPIVINPSSLISLYVVIFVALIVEAGVVTLLLTFRSVAVLKMFFAYLVANVMIYLLIFGLPFGYELASVPTREALAVLFDGLAIKLLVSFDALQGDDFKDVSWLRALCISCAGNAVSYFIGSIASHKP